jgi:hypothetical protein
LSTGRIARPNRVDARDGPDLRPVTEKDGAGAYFVERGPDGTAVETPLDTRRL